MVSRSKSPRRSAPHTLHRLRLSRDPYTDPKPDKLRPEDDDDIADDDGEDDNVFECDPACATSR